VGASIKTRKLGKECEEQKRVVDDNVKK